MRTVLATLSLVLPACEEPEDPLTDEEVESTGAAITGGYDAGVTQFEAVADDLGWDGCTGTLITRQAVLTSGHCACFDSDTCNATSFATFTDVVPAGGGARTDVQVIGDVYVHPDFQWDYHPDFPAHDLVVVRLPDPIEADAQITPIGLAVSLPSEGVNHTIVGFGYSGPTCTAPSGKKWASLLMADRDRFVEGTRLLDHHGTVHVCGGDSGGPTITPSNKVAGVGTMYSLSPDYWVSSYTSVYEAQSWIAEHACPDLRTDYPDVSFCNDPLCPCQPAEGDCDSDSHCVSGSVCLANVGEIVGLDTGYELCWQESRVMWAYRDTGYAGVSQRLPPGYWPASELGTVGANQISSLWIPAGFSAVVCNACVFPCIPSCSLFSGPVVSLTAPWNNNVDSIEMRGGTTFFGASGLKYYGTGSSVSDATMQSYLGGPVTSIAAAPGVIVSRCNPSCVYYWGTVPVYSPPPNSTWGVHQGMSLYADPGFTGTAQAFLPGSYTGSNITAFSSSAASSLVVAPGRDVEICWDTDCQTFTGWVNLPHDYNNRTITSFTIS